MRRKGTSIHQFLKRNPADVAEKARGMTQALRVGDQIMRFTISERVRLCTSGG